MRAELERRAMTDQDQGTEGKADAMLADLDNARPSIDYEDVADVIRALLARVQELEAKLAKQPPVVITNARLLARAEAAEAKVQELERELNGDGSCNPNPLKSLGLRACYQLRGEHIAGLERENAIEFNRGVAAADSNHQMHAYALNTRIAELEREVAEARELLRRHD